MNQDLPRSTFVERAYWVAAGLAVAGAVLPLLVTIGQSNRLAGVFWPFAAAAIGFGTLAMLYQHGKTFAALIYFLTGLALAYGMLMMLSVPLRLAVLGSCPRPPALCTNDLELQLSGGESTALSIAVAFGVMALLTGFVALAALYRQKAPAAPPAVWPDRPPEKPAALTPPAPVATAPPAAEVPEPQPEPKPEPPAPEPVAAQAAAADPAPKPRRKRRPRTATETAPEQPVQ